jgi:hypothetical protein
MSFGPQKYLSNTHGISESGSQYHPYDGSGTPAVPISQPRMTADEFRMAAMAMAGVRPGEPEVRCEDGLMEKDFFAQQMELLRQFQDAEPAPDMNERHIQMAIEEARVGLFTNADPPVPDEESYGPASAMYQSEALAAEPADLAPQDSFDHLKQAFEAQLCVTEATDFCAGDEMEPDFEAREAMLDDALLTEVGLEQDLVHETAEGADPSPAPGPNSLEQIVEAEEMDPMAEGTIEEPLDETAEPMEEAEPYPGPHPYGDPMMPEEMYDEMMMYGADPFMMGAYGPMLDPGPGGPP